MRVELWTSTHKNTRLMAVIRSSGGEMQIEAKEPIPPMILKDIEKLRGRVAGDEPFLRALTVEYAGTYLRAGFFKD